MPTKMDNGNFEKQYENERKEIKKHGRGKQ